MSDYDTAGYSELPLFNCVAQVVSSGKRRVSTGRKAKEFNESIGNQRDALSLLRDGVELTDVYWKELHPGSRVAPTIDKLRNAHGFFIDGDGSVKTPYFLDDVNELPSLIAVNDAIKDAYRASQHWIDTRNRRFSIDKGTCVLCFSKAEECHHIFYDLFNEKMSHLMSVCAYCHDKCHDQSRLKFPSGMKVEHAKRLGVEISFPDWLMPGYK